MNAPLGEVYWLNIIWAFYNMLFVIAMYYLGVAMYWWLSQARTRATQWQERAEDMQRKEYAEFECDRCGGDVPEDADKCPKCGATFDEEKEETKEDKEEAEFECDNCGADVPGDVDRCPKCGERFDEDEKESEEEAEFECDNCGADVPGDVDRCPKCGERFDEEEE
jgi:ribosomal protein L40E